MHKHTYLLINLRKEEIKLKSWKRRLIVTAAALVVLAGLTAGATTLVNKGDASKHSGPQLTYDDVDVDPIVEAAYELEPLILDRKVDDKLFANYQGYNYSEFTNTLTVNWKFDDSKEFDKGLETLYESKLKEKLGNAKSNAKIAHAVSKKLGDDDSYLSTEIIESSDE